MRSSLIDIYMTNILISHPLETPEKQRPFSISRVHKASRSTRKGSSDKIKTFEDLLQVKKTNK